MHEQAYPRSAEKEITLLKRKLNKSQYFRKRLEKTYDKHQTLLEMTTAELRETFQKFKEAQMQLIQSEKISVLGQMMAGIAHEMNTPIGVISTAIKSSQSKFEALSASFLKLFQSLSPELLSLFQQASQTLLAVCSRKQLSKRRENAAILEKKLQEIGVADGRQWGKAFANVGLTVENLDVLKPFATSPDALQLLYALTEMSCTFQDIDYASNAIVKLSSAIRQYTHSDPNRIAETDLKKELEGMLILFHHVTKGNIEIYQDLDPLPVIYAYTDQLNQLWTNLINNAVSALKGNGHIWIRLKNFDTDHIMVEVIDDGPGIPPDILPKIFEPYVTSKEKGEGTGLGLSISRDIVARHKGTLECESSPGRTLFRIILPKKI